jgi:DNA-binding transcriptional LysR family regulator
MLSLESLDLFCSLVEIGSFSRTADKHFLSQSAVSQRLRAMEKDCGQTLLDRGQGRGRIAPTDAGRLLYDGAKRLLREAEALDAQIQGLSDEVAGTVRVATVYSVGLHALPPRLRPFLADHPRVNVHLEYQQTGEVYRDVLAGTVDVGIVACPTPRRGLEMIPFAEEDMALVCAPEHPLADRSSVILRDLDGMAFVGFADDIPTRRLIDDHLRTAGVRVRLVNTFDNIETIKNLVEIGSGISILPPDTVQREVAAGSLASVAFAPADGFRRPTGLLFKATQTRRAAVRAFVEAMRAQ